jgi:hypothetical protein
MQPSATEGRTSAGRLSRLWRPSGVSDRLVLTLYRAWLVSAPFGAVSTVMALAGFGAAVAQRPFIGGKAILFLLAVGLVPVIIRHCMPLLTAARSSYLTRRGVPIRRTEQPRRYWFWVAATALPAAIELAVAAYLLSVALSLA